MARHSESTLAAIKHAVDIVSLVGDYLTVHRHGSTFKALCPFHDDHDPSLILNPDRQSFKCWSCGAGGDIFDFVKNFERVEFPEALRMLADRAGVALSEPATPEIPGLSKVDLFEVTAWAEAAFVEALGRSAEARGLPRRAGDLGRVRRPVPPRLRPRGPRLADRRRPQGGDLGGGPGTGRPDRPVGEEPDPPRAVPGPPDLPDPRPQGPDPGLRRANPPLDRAKAGRRLGGRVAKYLNSPQTPLFEKRRILYGADLARPGARAEGWVAVVEGYTDVIAAHQVGLSNVVGTLGTALGDDHVTALRRLADRAVLVFDGDEAGQKAADRSLELFLGHEVDVRVLTLPDTSTPATSSWPKAPGRSGRWSRGGRPPDLRDRSGLGPVRLRLARRVEAGGRVGPGDPRQGPQARGAGPRPEGGQGPRHALAEALGPGGRPEASAPGSANRTGPPRPTVQIGGTRRRPRQGPTPGHRSGRGRPRPDRPRADPDRP